MNIFKFEFKRLLKSCLTWTVVCGVMIALFMSLFPTMADMGIQELVNDKMGALSVDMLKVFNIDAGMDFSDIFNYMAYVIQYIAMASAVYGAILGVNALIKEESQGTIEFLYSKPIKRSKIVTTKLLSIILIYFVYIVIIGAITIIVSLFVKPDNVKLIELLINIKIVYMGMFILGLVFMSIGMLISALVKSDKGGIPISIGIFFVSYLFGIIGKLKEDFELLKYFSPFDYYAPGELLKNGFEMKFVIIGLCVMFVSIASTYLIYEKKDMNI